MRVALRVCSRYVSRFTVSPQLISIVFGGLFGLVFCVLCFGGLFGVFVCLLLTFIETLLV